MARLAYVQESPSTHDERKLVDKHPTSLFCVCVGERVCRGREGYFNLIPSCVGLKLPLSLQ